MRAGDRTVVVDQPGNLTSVWICSMVFGAFIGLVGTQKMSLPIKRLTGLPEGWDTGARTILHSISKYDVVCWVKGAKGFDVH